MGSWRVLPLLGCFHDAQHQRRSAASPQGLLRDGEIADHILDSCGRLRPGEVCLDTYPTLLVDEVREYGRCSAEKSVVVLPSYGEQEIYLLNFLLLHLLDTHSQAQDLRHCQLQALLYLYRGRCAHHSRSFTVATGFDANEGLWPRVFATEPHVTLRVSHRSFSPCGNPPHSLAKILRERCL